MPPLEENLLLVEVNRLDATRGMLESRMEVFTLQLKALRKGSDRPLRPLLYVRLVGPAGSRVTLYQGRAVPRAMTLPRLRLN